MAKKSENTGPAPQMKQKANGYKLRTTNDLLLLSMILDDDAPLREKVMRFMEAQLGKAHGGKSKDRD
jgi:hypothetical protein